MPPAVVFHAGTAAEDGTDSLRQRRAGAGGDRLLAGTLAQALEGAYAAVSQVHFEGVQYRKDIGRKGLRRDPACSARLRLKAVRLTAGRASISTPATGRWS